MGAHPENTTLRTDETLRDMLRLMFTPGLGAVRLRRVVEHCKGPSGAVRADFEQLRQVPGLNGAQLDYLARKQWDDRWVDRQLEMIEACGALPLMYWQESYPAYLAQIYDPPPAVRPWRPDLAEQRLPGDCRHPRPQPLRAGDQPDSGAGHRRRRLHRGQRSGPRRGQPGSSGRSGFRRSYRGGAGQRGGHDLPA